MTITSVNVLNGSDYIDNTTGAITPALLRLGFESAFGLPPSPNGTQTGTPYPAQLTDRGTVVEMNSASAQTFSIPTNGSVAFDVGTVIAVYQMGAGTVTISAATPGTTTLRPAASVTTRAQFSTVLLRKRATDEWVASGDYT